MTDGHTKVNAVEREDVKNLTNLTPPGTKLLLTGCKVILGRILLENSNCIFLGGGVQQLLEAWQANLNAQHFRLSVSGGKNKSHSLSVGVALPPQFELNLASADKTDYLNRGNLSLPPKETERGNSRENSKLPVSKESSKEIVSTKVSQREDDVNQRKQQSHSRGRGGRGTGRYSEGRGAGNGDGGGGDDRGRDRASDSRHGRGRGRGRHSHILSERRGTAPDHAAPPPSVSHLLDLDSLFPPLPGRLPGKDWSCSGCTYLNNASLTYCEMCELKR